MLDFFRQYQRYVFFVVTVVVIASFVFFGTFNAFVENPVPVDRSVGQTINGCPIKLSEVQKLSRFLSTDREDFLQGRGLLPNLCNDGVIRHDFLKARLADLLVAEYFEALKGDLELRLEKVKRFRPYVHPEAPYLSAKAIWEHLLPSLVAELTAVQKEETASLSIFSHLAKLYALQNQLPPETLRRILIYHHQQYPWLPVDQRLGEEDLSLFGFHSVPDWFGPGFVDLISQFILNAADLAESKGYKVSLEEAKGDLVHNFLGSREKWTHLKGSSELNFHQHLQMLGFDERSAVEVWRKVLLFRRYFDEIGEATFVDQLPYQDFAQYAEEAAIVNKYEWPIGLKTAQDLANYQFYIKAVCPPMQGAIPSQVLSVEEVEKKYPDLVQTTYRAKVAEITKKQVGLRASLKEVWAWETADKNWPSLKDRFSLPEASTSEERFKVLQRLEPPILAQVHALAREYLVEENPSWIQEALAALPLEEKTWEVAGQGEPILKGEGIYYRIEEIEKVKEKHIVPFSRAQQILTQRVGPVEGDLPQDKNPFLKAAQEALSALQKDPSDPRWVQSGMDLILDQFKFQKKEQMIPRNSQENWMKEQAFMMMPGFWSPIHVAEQEIAFFYLQERKANPAPILEQLNFGKETLAADARRYVAERLLQMIKKKNAMAVPLQREEHEPI